MLKTLPIVRAYLYCTAICVGVSTALYTAFPLISKAFLNENRLIEVLTVFAYLMACVVGLYTATKLHRGPARITALLLAALSFVWVLDETSFGRSLIYKYDRIKIYDVSIDAVHDFLSVFVAMAQTDTTSTAFRMTLGALLCLLIGCFLFYKKHTVACKGFLTSESCLLLSLSLLLLIIAGTLDIINTRDVDTLRYIEEMLEFAAALAMLYAAYAWLTLHLNITPKKATPTS